MSSHTTMNTDLLREMVCENCPATGWGKKALCQVHDRHVGKIQACPEWDKFVREQQERGGNLIHSGEVFPISQSWGITFRFE